MKRIFTLLVTSTLLVTTTNPVITFLSKHMTPQGKSIYVVGDHHYAHQDDTVGKAQATSLLQFAKVLPQVFVIAEDILTYTGTNEDVKKNIAFIKTLQKTPFPGLRLHLTFREKDLGWQQAWGTSPLIGFVDQCTQAAVPCCSIEFRHTRDASAGQIAKITCPEVLASLDTVMKEIESYNDGEKLTRYYDFAINNYLNESQRKLLQKKDYAQQSIFETFSTLPKEFAKMMLFGVNLMVPRLLHAIHTNENKNNLIIFVGDEHAKNLTEVLIKLGYKNREVLYKEPRITKDEDTHIRYIQISALDLEPYFEQELKQLKATTSQETSVRSATTAASSSSSSSSAANSASSTTVEPKKA